MDKSLFHNNKKKRSREVVDAPRRIKLAFNATNTSMLNASRAAAWEYQQQPKNLIELEERFFLVFRLLLEDLILLSLKILSFAGFLFSLRKKRYSSDSGGFWPLIVIYEARITSKHTKTDAENPQIMVIFAHE